MEKRRDSARPAAENDPYNAPHPALPSRDAVPAGPDGWKPATLAQLARRHHEMVARLDVNR